MCSIGGWIAEKPLGDSTARLLARALIYYGRDRGQQSAGVWGLDEAGGKLYKRAIDPHDFVYTQEWEEYWNNFDPRVCLVHTRQPTSGGRGDAQAQPFMVGDSSVVVVHNGWFTNVKTIKEAHQIEKPSGVDSELVASFVAAHGIESIEEFFNTAIGSAAVAIWNKGKLYLARSRGPIEYITVTTTDNVLTVFGSTEEQVMAAIRYVWLIDLHDRTETVPTLTLAEVLPKDVVSVLTWRNSFRPYTRPNHTPAHNPDDAYMWVRGSDNVPRLVPREPATAVDDGGPDDTSAVGDVPPPGVPETPAERNLDYHNLGVKLSFTGLDEAERARFAFYVASED